ncbi:MAG: carboxypeptidase regulatory-like domain-containing protein, partial [Candidatus Cloacimonadaceae bacterium]
MNKSVITTIIFSVIMLLTLPLSAFVYDYTFIQTTGTYTEITGGVSLGTETTDDQRFLDPAFPAGGFDYTGPGLPIGFNFSFNDNPFDVIGINANGWISFGQSALGATAVNMNSTSGYSPLSSTVAITPAQLGNRVTGFARDIQAQVSASIRMETIGTAPNRICVIQWKNYKRYGTTGTGDFINYQIQLQETTNKVSLHYGSFTIGATASTIYPQVGLRGPEISDFFNRTTDTDWTATTSGTSFAATCAFSTTCLPVNGLVFEFVPPATVPNDLQALSISGPTGPAVGTAADYTITIRNRGTAAQSTYTIQLMSGTTVLASVPGPGIQPEEVIPVVVSHTFTQQGPITIFGRINFAADENLLNNDTNTLDLVVQASGTMLVEIGNGTANQRQPFGIFYDYERDAALYTAAEIGAFGAITAVKWYVGAANPYVVPYKIYLKTTTDTALGANPWATMITDATLMLDATYSFSQTGWVTFNFTTPFVYTSGNLLVLVETNVGDWQSSYATFRYHTAPAGHHEYWYQDGSIPTGNGNLNTNRPDIGLFLVTAGMGHLAGTVTAGATPLEGATITVETTTYNATSSATGTYNIQYIPQGNYTVTCSKIGYVTQTLPVTIVENQTATLNFNMAPSPTVNVTGTVVGSDAPTVGLADANVVLTGIMDYNATTNAQGVFTITGVLGSETYSYTISKAGYSPATGTINVGAVDYSMGTVTLNEVAYPATGVQAVEAAPNVNLTWTAPNPNVQDFEDSFETYADFAIDFPPWANLDVDQSATYGYNGFDFPGEYGVMAYMVFNPLTTTPNSTTQMGT